MADSPLYPGSNGNAGDESGGGSVRGSITGTPRWVKVFGIIVTVLALVFLILHFTGNSPFPSHLP